MNHMKDYNAIQYGYYLVLVSRKCRFMIDRVQFVGNNNIEDLETREKDNSSLL